MPDAAQIAIDHFNAGRVDQAEAVLRRALTGKPRDPELNGLLAGMLSSAGKHEQSAFFFERALVGKPDEPSLRLNYGNMLLAQGRPAEAKPQFEEALRLRPDESAALAGLAAALHKLMDDEGAIAAARRAVEIDPGDSTASTNLAAALSAVGRVHEALSIMRGLLRRPDPTTALITSYLMTLHYDPAMSPGAIAEEHRRWGEVLAQRAPACTTRLIERHDADRPLRVGFLSPDFRQHVVALFIEPLWKHLDRARVSVRAYHLGVTDSRTAQLKALADGWCDARGLSDADLVARIRADRVDVLVDLAGHTEGCRPAVLAGRTAPVQATYLGYPNTTGLAAVDYRLVDAWTDPPGSDSDAWHVERVLRLSRCAWCFTGPTGAALPPVERDGPADTPVVFGCFNAAPKINLELLRLWGAAIAPLAGTRLVIKHRSLTAPSVRTHTLEALAAGGLAADRVDLRTWTPPGVSHLASYRDIDYALDPYPYHGTTTTCESLLMGVPVVSRIGAAHVSRVGLSLLTAVGLQEFAATSETEYVARIRQAAADVHRWRDGRARVRRAFLDSAIADGPGLARAFEEALGRMWKGQA